MRAIDGYSYNILDRTKKFAVDVIRLSSNLPKNSAGYSISNQLVRSATSIGANLIEAQEAISKADFVFKMSISLKEAKETRYWLELVTESQLLERLSVVKLHQECDEIIRILVASVKTSKEKK